MNKYCSGCGKELEENEKVCKNCGKNVETINQTVLSQTTTNNSKKTNGFAIAGFVISIVSIFCCGLPSWLGLVFSIIGLVNANKGEGEGKGFAIAGIVISAILLVLLIALYSLGFVASFAEGFEQGYNGVYYY